MTRAVRSTPLPRRGKSSRRRLLASAAVASGTLACLMTGARALAQDLGTARNIERFDRQIDALQRQTRLQVDQAIPFDQRALIDYGAYITTLAVSADDPAQNATILLQPELVGYARVNLDGAHEFFARGRWTYRWFLEGDNPFGDNHDTDTEIDRLYYRFDLARFLASTKGEQIDGNVQVQVGRQLVNWGNGLVLSQDLDGGILDLSYGKASVELLGGVTPEHTLDFDPFRPGSNDDTQRAFWGALASYQFTKHRPYVYFLNQDDQNDRRSVGSGATATKFKYDSYYVGVGSTGDITDQLVYAVEMVYEGGDTLSGNNGTGQTEDDIEAYALDARLDYLFNDPRNTRASVETIVATGDADRGSSNSSLNGNRSGTNDGQFNAFGLLNTGLAFSPSVTNLVALRTGVSTYPWNDSVALRRLQVGTDVFFFSKYDDDAPIDEPSAGGWWFGSEIDLYATWQITSDVSLIVRYGIFFPGSAIGGDKDPRNFVAVGLTYAF